jgi:hypothetical protein
MPTRSSSRDVALDMLMCISMMFLYIGGVACVIIQGNVLEERYGKHNILDHTNVYESFILDVIFLVAPFLGGCSAFRLLRSSDYFGKIIGWLFVVLFALLFFQSALIEWTQYRDYQVLLRR